MDGIFLEFMKDFSHLTGEFLFTVIRMDHEHFNKHNYNPRGDKLASVKTKKYTNKTKNINEHIYDTIYSETNARSQRLLTWQQKADSSIGSV